MLHRVKKYVLLAILGYQGYARHVGVQLGSRCAIATASWGSEPYLIKLGNRVRVTAGVSFITHDGAVWVGRESRPTFDVFGEICIGDDTYIGNGATLLPGVRIGRRCVVGAHAVVTKSIPDNTVVAGNPARFICTTDDYLSRMTGIDFGTHGLTGHRKRSRVMRLMPDRGVVKPNIPPT